MIQKSLVMTFITFAMALSVQAGIVSKKSVQGTIVDVVIGEISVGLGDACIIGVETTENKLVAVVTDFDACVEAEMDSDKLVGKSIFIPAAELELINDQDTLRLYKEFAPEYFFMNAYFGNILKGIK